MSEVVAVRDKLSTILTDTLMMNLMIIISVEFD